MTNSEDIKIQVELKNITNMTTFSNFQQNSIKPADSNVAPGVITKNVVNPIKEAFSSGMSQAGQALTSKPSFENTLKLGSGLATAITSPLAPIFKPTVGAATGALSDKISDIPAVQKFAMSPAGQTASRVAEDTGNAANIAGTVAGGMEVAGKVSNIWDKAYATPTEAVSSRTADATPAYDKNLVGQNVKTPEGNIAPRVNEGQGITGKRTITTSASEAQSGQELSNLPNYPDKGTALEKGQAVEKGINQEAESMRSGLKTEDTTNPLDVVSEKAKMSNLITKSLPEDIQAKIGILSPEENAMLKGMQEKVGAPQPEGGKFDLKTPGEVPNLPKTAAGRYYAKVLDSLNEYDGTREGKLNLRQAIDQAYKSEGGKYAYGSDSQNALQEVHTEIRNAINKDLGESTQNTDTQTSLQKQTNLYRAKDVLDTKAQAEASSQIGRFYQNHPLLHRLATREFLGTAAKLTGTAALTAYITKVLSGKQ